MLWKRKSKKRIIENSVILVDKIKNIIANFYGKYNDQYSFKSFFVDSDLDDPDDDSLIEKEKIINWVKELPILNTMLIKYENPRFKRIYMKNTQLSHLLRKIIIIYILKGISML